VRLVVCAALLWGAAWLTYRVGFTWHRSNPVAFVVLLLVEAYSLIALAFLAFVAWSWTPSTRPGRTLEPSVDVFVCTYNEPVDVVEATLAGCAALRYPHRTWLLDDGRRPAMQALAQRWGARWVTRPDNDHAKAGNINHALGVTAGELIFFLDADHVPLPDALDALVGYFDDEDVALVQTPHDFYNQDSVQHYEPGRHEQSLFFEVVCPGKDRHNGVFWCGSATLVRRAALEQVGGVATDTIAEDFHTTVKMHRLGWVTRFHNEVLVQGLAPVDLDGYLLQRDRWARGNLAVFRLEESPLRRSSGLNLRQRVSYFSSLFAYASGVVRLAMICLMITTLGFGVLPAHVTPVALLALWVPTTVLAVTSTTALCRGHIRLGESSHYTLLTAEVFTRALRCAFIPSRVKFKVTPKEGTDTGGWPAIRHLRTVLVLAVVLVGAFSWRLLGAAGWLPVRPLPRFATIIASLLAVWELYRIANSVRRVGKHRQQRVHYRFACALPAEVTEPPLRAATVVDASTAGFAIVTREPVASGTTMDVSFAAPDVDDLPIPIVARLVARSCEAVAEGRWRVGASIVELDDASRRNLFTFCHVVHPYHQLRDVHVDEVWPALPMATRTEAPAPAHAEIGQTGLGQTGPVHAPFTSR
jgi:cellulose synthase (UDP-forming)